MQTKNMILAGLTLLSLAAMMRSRSFADIDKKPAAVTDEHVYNRFSIGGKYIKKWADGNFTRYTASPTEVSIVDNPCMRGAMFTMVKNDGSSELRKFVPPDRLRSLESAVENLTKAIEDLVASRARAAAAKRFDPCGADNPNQAHE